MKLDRIFLLLACTVFAMAALGACSVANAPDDPVEPSDTTSSTGGSGSGGMGGSPPACENDAECEDGDNCTIDSCSMGSCDTVVVDPDDGDLCTADSCDAAGAPVNEAVTIDDGDPCTFDSCDPLVGVMNIAERIVFEHDFSDALGWSADPPWEIGPAAPSGVSQILQWVRDPPEDHSPSMDEGLAGVVIGGFAPTTVMAAPAYLESAEFDGTIQEGELILSYWRVLSSDYEPYMVNTVDVWDGAAWQPVFSSGPPPGYADTQWQHVNHNVTAFANPQMKVRFGFFVNSGGAFGDVGSWSVDDVRVFNAAFDVVDGDLCTQDLCDPVMGVIHPPIDIDDMNACTADTCDPARGPNHVDTSIKFMADFASTGGFSVGPEWSIGPAVAGGNTDPGMDETPSNDNRIAGVAIGGNYVTATLHPYYYLETNFFSTAGSGQVVLQFKRWLTSDYTPYVDNVIEVRVGTVYNTVWQSGPSPGIVDTQWQTMSYDLTPFSNASMRVRWGFNINNSGVIARGGWNIDDVIIRDPTCDSL